MVPLKLRFLGKISVKLADREYREDLPDKALALLCYLAVTAEAQTRETLASLLWSDFPELRARSNLRDTLALLRRSPLAPYLDIKRRTIALNGSSPYWLDTAEFENGVTLGIKDLPIDPACLETAVARYQGEFLPGFLVQRAALFEEWVTVQRRQLHLQAIEALQQLVDYYLDAHDYECGIAYARRLLSLDTLREETQRNLILLLWLNGETDRALKQYQQCKQILADELGVAPSRETETLVQNIHKQGNNRQVGTAPISFHTDSPAVQPVPCNIPSQLTPFIGREREQRAIDNALGDHNARLLTIFGVGGIGKTRLAIAVGEQQIQRVGRDGEFRFPDGVFFASLEAIESITEIVPALCQAIGFRPADSARAGRSEEEQLLDHLNRKQLLLIIDNLEHLQEGIGLLAKIHRTAPQLQMLITSRQKLFLQGERLYALQGLRYPQEDEVLIDAQQLLAEYSAAALFVAGARRVVSTYQLWDEEVPTLIRLCHLVEGMPLALELAAGWTNVLSLADIVTEIEGGLSFLASDLLDVSDRHHSMAAVFEVSWQRLPIPLQIQFAQLCVFRGGFTRHTAQEIIGTSIRQLASLANNGLIQYDKDQDRYQIHRLLRQFGAEKLAQDPSAEKSARERHGRYFCRGLQEWDRQLKGTGQLAALLEIENESANARAAWLSAIRERNFAQIEQAANGLNRFYLWRGRFLAGETACRLAHVALFQAATASTDQEDLTGLGRILVNIQLWQSVFCKQAEAKVLVDQAIAALNSPQLARVDARREKAFGLQRAGDLSFNEESHEAAAYYEQSLSLYRQLNDPWGTAKILTELGWLAAHEGAVEKAQSLGEEALVLVREIGDCRRTADVLWLLGTLAIIEGNVEAATRLLNESLDRREKLGNRIADMAAGPLDLGMILTWIGRFGEADAIREETLAHYQAQGQEPKIAQAHVFLANSKIHMGQFDLSEQHAKTGLALCRKVGNERGAGMALWTLGGLTAFYQNDLDRGETLLQESLAIFRAIEGAPELGWVYGAYALIARLQGKPVVAKQYIGQGLGSASGIMGLISVQFNLIAYALIRGDEGQAEEAIEILTLLTKYPAVAKSPGMQLMYSDQLDRLKSALPKEVVAQAEARGRARDLQETAAEVLAELFAPLDPTQ